MAATSSLFSPAWVCIVALSATAMVQCERPQRAPLRFYPAAMRPEGPHFLTDSGGVTFWGNGSLRLRLYMEKGPMTIILRAGGNVAAGEPPRAGVFLDGQRIALVEVPRNEPEDYTVHTELADSRTRTLEIRFDNFLRLEPALASRVLHIESVTVHQPR